MKPVQIDWNSDQLTFTKKNTKAARCIKAISEPILKKAVFTLKFILKLANFNAKETPKLIIAQKISKIPMVRHTTID